MIPFTRPLCFLDTESTGVDIATARIVEFGVFKLLRDGQVRVWSERFNPLCPIPAEATAVHGITDADVAEKFAFAAHAKFIHRGLVGCDLAGYNLASYDVPLLWEELYRAGITWDLTGVRIIDVRNIWTKMEPRTLSDALRRFCGREHGEAHGALADAEASRDILYAQLETYAHIERGVDALAVLSRFDDVERVDLAGKLVRDAEGDAVWTIGNVKGKKLRETLDFAQWALGKDFPANTKLAIRAEMERVQKARVA